MQGQFVDLMAAADFLGPAAVEVDRYQTEIFDIVRRRGVFGQRIKQVPATGHPSRFFAETAIPAPSAAQAFVDPRNIVPTVQTPARIELSVPLKALVSQINYNLFDLEVTAQQSQFAYLQAKDLADAVDGLMRTHDVALWNGTDTSLSAPTTAQYFGVVGQIAAGGNTVTIGTTKSIVDGLKTTVAQMVASSAYQVRPTAIYANPMLLDLIDQEMKTEFNVVLNTVGITGWLPREGTDDSGWGTAADSGMGVGVHRSDRDQCGIAGLHRERGPDRVSLADRSESASVQAGSAWISEPAASRREVWGSSGEGG